MTQSVPTNTLCGYFCWNKNQFVNDTNRVHRGTYKSPNSLIHIKFMSWKVAENVMTSIISANKAGKLNIFAGKKQAKKIWNKMNSLLLKCKEFKQDVDKKLWKFMLCSQGW